MSSRPNAGPYAALNSTTGQSMSGNLTSRVSIIQFLSMPSYAVSWTGSTPVGTIAVQVSNDYSQNADGTVNNAGTWNVMPFTDLTGTLVTSIPISGNSGNGFIDITDTSAYAIRLVYTSGSGSGTLNAIFAAKVS